MDLVTGASGLAGFHVLLELQKRGQSVRALIRRNEDAGKIWSRLESEGIFSPKVEFFTSNLLDPDGMFEACSDIKNIYHCAGLVSFSKSDRDQLIEANCRGTANLVNQALENKCRKLIHVSSVAALGVPKSAADVNETFIFENKSGVSAYSLSKHLAEREVWRGIEEGLNAVIVNPSIIIGKGDWSRSSMRLFERASKGMTFFSPGANGFVDARDLAALMITLAESNIHSELFVINGVNISYKDFFELLSRELGFSPPRQEASRWIAEIMWRIEHLLFLISGRKPLLTRETVDSAFRKKSYDSKKIQEIAGFTFTPLQDTLRWIAGDQGKNASGDGLSR